jgi:uncharacterized delta-60 repeat protein
MSASIGIKAGTTTIPGVTVKGDFSYFLTSALSLGPTSTTGFYSGIDAPDGGYTVYQIGGPNGLNARVASNTDELNTILITAGATGSTLNDRIIWATNTNSIFVNSGSTASIVNYFGGDFTIVNNVTANNVVSLNTDGSVDTSFNVGPGASAYISTSAIQSDGKILLGGAFSTFSGVSRQCLVRVNTNGSIDTSFNVGTGFENGGAVFNVFSVSIQSDGKILVGGQFITYNGTFTYRLVRLNTNGSIDTVFNFGAFYVYTTAIQSDGKILAGGAFTTFNGAPQNYLIRLNSNGSKDTTFNIESGFSNNVFSTAIQSDGKILAGGSFTTFTGSTQVYLIRLNTNGSKDTSFNLGAGFDIGFEEGENVSSIAIQSDGKILVGGYFFGFSGMTYNSLMRFNTNGSVDTSFNSGFAFFYDAVNSIVIESDGKILVGSGSGLKRLNTDGSINTSFFLGGGVVYTTKIQSSGKILVGGSFTTAGGTSQNYMLKTSNYLLDTSFDIGSGFNSTVNSISIQSDRKILAGGSFTTFTGSTQNRLIRLNLDGSKDTTFDIGSGFNSNVYTIDIQSDGKILVGGEFTTFIGSTQNRLIRLNSNGSKDTTFNIGIGFDRDGLLGTTVYSIAIQSDGKILVGGIYSRYSASTQNNLIRLNSDGSKDTSFNIGSGFNATVFPIDIQSDGKILVGGSFTTFTGSTQNFLIRLNTDGSKDTSFNIGSGFNSTIRSIDIQSDSKILVGGNFTTYSGTTQNYITRLNSNGTRDTSFNIGTGFNANVNSIYLQSDSKILVGGNFTTYQGVSSFRNILLNSDGSISNNSLTLNSTVFSVAIQQ